MRVYGCGREGAASRLASRAVALGRGRSATPCMALGEWQGRGGGSDALVVKCVPLPIPARTTAVNSSGTGQRTAGNQ